ncbi:MAG: hypothetical protein NWR72_00330 [Bacteroidia bacterium]|nr:hypothetical protein [Bacteroidia bacterium]
MSLQFKTNINCGGCIAKVTPFLDGEAAIQTWSVDTDNPDKILTVETAWSSAEVIALVQSAGFTATEKKKGVFGKLFG